MEKQKKEMKSTAKKNTTTADPYALIMAGGIGSRFWPVSKNKHPKQFLDILGTGKSLIRQTYERFIKFIPPENIYVVTNEVYKKLLAKEIPELTENQILLEPARKNTAPCVAYAAYKIASLNTSANIIVAPSDHVILDEEKFRDVVKQAVAYTTQNDDIITLGIRPTRPDTGYGYIQFIEEQEEPGIHKVKTFLEKPTKVIAKTIYNSGDFLWNAGIFVAGVKTWIKAFSQHLPEMDDLFRGGKKFWNTSKEPEFISEAYGQCMNVSIDIGIMEKASNVKVIPSQFGWSDLGTWASLYEQHEKDYLGNAVNGKNVTVYDANNNMVMVPDNKLVVLQGIENFIVVETDDVLLICSKENEQEIKQIVQELKRTRGDKWL